MTMTLSTCTRMPLSAHNNRQHHHVILISDDNHLQDTAILKPSQLKLAATRLPVPRHEAAADDDRTEEETLTRSCTEDQDDNDEEESVSMRPAFRTRTIWKDVDDELDSLWTLKRASPITDANDEEEDYLSQYQSPAKRSRVQTLVWSESLPETSESVQELLQRR